MAMLPARKRSSSSAVALGLHGGGQIAVLDDEEAIPAFAKVANLFFRIGLGDHLARHLRAAPRVKPDESGIDHAHEGIVHLEVAEDVDSRRPHCYRRHHFALGRAGSLPCPSGLMAMRPLSSRMIFPGKVHRRHTTLREEMHGIGPQPKEIRFLKKRPRWRRGWRGSS